MAAGHTSNAVGRSGNRECEENRCEEVPQCELVQFHLRRPRDDGGSKKDSHAPPLRIGPFTFVHQLLTTSLTLARTGQNPGAPVMADGVPDQTSGLTSEYRDRHDRSQIEIALAGCDGGRPRSGAPD